MKAKEFSEVVEKFNPYHGKDGRFTSAGGAASFTYRPGSSKGHDKAIENEKKRNVAAVMANSKRVDPKEQKKKAEDTYTKFKNGVKAGMGDPSNLTTKKLAPILDEMPKGAKITLQGSNPYHSVRDEWVANGGGKWKHDYVVNGTSKWSHDVDSYRVASDIRSTIGGGVSIYALGFENIK